MFTTVSVSHFFPRIAISNGNIFLVTDPLWGESTRHRCDSPHKGQWHVALTFVYLRLDERLNNRDAGYLRSHRPHYDVTVNLTLIDRSWSVRKYLIYCLSQLYIFRENRSICNITSWYSHIDIMTDNTCIECHAQGMTPLSDYPYGAPFTINIAFWYQGTISLQIWCFCVICLLIDGFM